VTQKTKIDADTGEIIEERRRKRKQSSTPWPPGKWRLGIPSVKAKFLFMRYATNGVFHFVVLTIKTSLLSKKDIRLLDSKQMSSSNKCKPMSRFCFLSFMFVFLVV
jgi:hypothetical protein